MNAATPRIDPATGEVLADPAPIPGARGIASVAKEHAQRAKLKGAALFAGLAVVGLGFVYFVAPKPKSAAQLAADAAKRESTQKINAEMPVPKIHVPTPAATPEVRPAGSSTDAGPSAAAGEGVAAAVLGDRPELPGDTGAYTGYPGAVAAKSAAGDGSGPGHPSHSKSVLSSPVLYRANGAGAGGSTGLSPAALEAAREASALLPPEVTPASTGGNGALANALKPTVTPAVRAERLPSRRWLLPKGTFADCTLETAIDSTLPGMTTCVLALDVFGADGTVVLLERGTHLVGEARSDVRPGQSRVAILWTEARTPTGVVAHLDSLGTDELGRSGVPGSVDTHFRERFGAAILISLVDSASQALANRSNSGSGGVVLNPSRSTDVLTEILRQTIAIPPTIHVPQGARLQVLVARDVDFRSVYALKDRS